jgi:hypothetical protein
MFERADIDCPALTQMADRLGKAGELTSVFFRSTAALSEFPRFDRGLKAVLTDVLNSDYLRETLPWMFPLDQDTAMRFSHLDRFEFEGWLMSLLVRGACAESIVCDEAEARQWVQAILQGIPHGPDRSLRVFRMDDAEWSALTRGATLCSAAFVYTPAHRIWWFIAFADFY